MLAQAKRRKEAGNVPPQTGYAAGAPLERAAQ